MYFLHLRMIIQILNNLECVFYMTFYTKRQCFQSLKENKGTYRRDCCTGITEKDRTDLCNKSSRTAGFCEADSMIARVWLCQRREFTGSLPVKFTAFNDHTTDRSSMTADKFCHRMNHDICTIFDRSYKVRCCKGIIYNKRDLMSVSDLSARFNINNI